MPTTRRIEMIRGVSLFMALTFTLGACGGGVGQDACEEVEWPAGSGACVDDPCDPDPCTSDHQVAASCEQTAEAEYRCECETGYTGDACEGCAAGYHDDGAGACVEDIPCTAISCSDHGDCDDTSGEPVCTCFPGYAGLACDVCDVGYHDDGFGACVEDLPAFLNGIDENTYLAQWTGKTYSDAGQTIPTQDLPYAYFAAKGANAARIRVWVGSANDGNYQNALANGLAARAAGLRTLLAIFFSEQWSDNIGCDPAQLGSIFQGLTYDDKKLAVGQYVTTLLQDFRADGLTFDLYAVGNEVYACLCGESDRARMAELFNIGATAVRAEDPDAEIVLHVPHAPPAWQLAFFDEMLNTHQVDCDYLSSSFYPMQYGAAALTEYQQLVSDLYATHGKQFIVSEWSYADGPLPANAFWLQAGILVNDPVAGYPLTPQGQADLVGDLHQWGKDDPAVAAVFYWGSMFNELLESGGVYYGWVWLSLFDAAGAAKPAVDSIADGALP